MHGLTPAEFHTVRAILDRPQATERERIESSGVPGSTYLTARRRVYSEGWIADRMVPNPGALGCAAVEFDIRRPSLLSRDDLISARLADPACALLWVGVHVVFAINFVQGSHPGAPLESGGHDPTDALLVKVSRDEGCIPVFFDYSGLWRSFGRLGPPPSYPAGLSFDSTPASPGVVAAAQEFLESNGSALPGTSRWAVIARSSRRHEQAFTGGAVLPRTILDPARVPPNDGRRLGEVIFVWGALRPGSTASGLLAALTSEARVYPFLLAGSGQRVLLAGIGQTKVASSGRLPARSGEGQVTPVLHTHLESAQFALEPTESIVPRVHHRYELGGASRAVDVGR